MTKRPTRAAETRRQPESIMRMVTAWITPSVSVVIISLMIFFALFARAAVEMMKTGGFDDSLANIVSTLLFLITSVAAAIMAYQWGTQAGRLENETKQQAEEIARKNQEIESHREEIANKDRTLAALEVQKTRLENELRKQADEITRKAEKVETQARVIAQKDQAIAALTDRTTQLEDEKRRQAEEIAKKNEEIKQLEIRPLPRIVGFKEFLDYPEQIPLIEKLFERCSQVTIEKKFAGGHRNKGVFLIKDSDNGRFILKFASTEDIKKEITAREYMQGHLHNVSGYYCRHAFIGDDGNLGGILYTLPSFEAEDTLTNFDEYYRKIDEYYRKSAGDDLNDGVQEIKKVIQLCSKPLGKLHGDNEKSLSLFRQYCLTEPQTKDVQKALSKLPEINARELYESTIGLAVGGSTEAFTNPILWLDKKYRENKDYPFQVVAGPIHGDFHSGNILLINSEKNIDSKSIRILDFANSSPNAHTLTDFSRLEADVKFYLMTTGLEKKEFYYKVYNFEKEVVLKPQNKQGLAQLKPVPREYPKEFKRTREFLMSIREHAQSELITADIRPYYLSLLYWTLRMIAFEQCQPYQQFYAFLSASLLCDKIDGEKRR